jgi:hypothetical protein
LLRRGWVVGHIRFHGLDVPWEVHNLIHYVVLYVQ